MINAKGSKVSSGTFEATTAIGTLSQKIIRKKFQNNLFGLQCIALKSH